MRAISAKSGGVAPYLGVGRGWFELGWGCVFKVVLWGREGEKGKLTSPYTPSLHFQTFVLRLVHW